MTAQGGKVLVQRANIGRARYLVEFHDGLTTHGDGSPFYDVRLFGNKRKKDRFVKDLRAQGFTEA